MALHAENQASESNYISALLSLIAASAAVCDCNGFKSDGEKMPTTVDRIIWLFDA